MKLSGGVPPSARQISPDSLAEFDQILAGHLVVDAEREPAHRPVRLPLQLAAPAGDRRGDALAAVRILVGDGAGLGVVRHDRHLQHDAGARARSAGTANRSAPAPARSDGSMIAITASKRSSTSQQRRVEAAGHVAVGRGQELVFEPEACRERRAAAHCCAAPKLGWVPNGSGTLRQRLAQMLRHHAPCWGCCRAPCAARPCRPRRRSAGS